MISGDEYKRLLEDHEIAYFKGDLATSMPESHSFSGRCESSMSLPSG